MAPTTDNLLLENPLLKTYAFYVSVLSLKMIMMTFITSFNRVKSASFISSEDVPILKMIGCKDAKVGSNDVIDRIKRAHMNDLENIPVFMFISFLYIMTNPSLFIASMLFRIYTIARIMHTIGHYFLASAVIRGAGWIAAFDVTIYMAAQLILSCYS